MPGIVQRPRQSCLQPRLNAQRTALAQQSQRRLQMQQAAPARRVIGR
jgi:hypothetical protein